MSNSDRVQAWRKRAKQKLVDISGGKCALCDYNKCITALEYHHLDPSQKDFPVTGGRDTKRFELMVDEARKCIMVCANCHREIHYGLVDEETLAAKYVFNEDLAKFYLNETQEAKASGRFKKK